ncbi:tensin-3 isoform X1 [Alosa sapidissima]|uniref:tensin-3 isoform X1 n=1 Tax=Alosa sapidissima TaxID=34773 RepID=UPI001C08B4A1|nr:tensin-3 isoform X1 [Alosa sapidissima]
MEQDRHPLDVAAASQPHYTDSDPFMPQEIPTSENALHQSEQAEQVTDILDGKGGPAPKEQIMESECVILSSEDMPSFLDTPTASSLVTGSIDSLQSEGLEALIRHSSLQVTLPLRSTQAGGTSDTHTHVLAGASPKHTHTHAWVQEQQQLSHTLSHSSVSLEVGIATDQEAENEEEEFDLLAKDFDQSLDELNQLIMDLDPEFEPNPTPTRRHMTRSASLYTNGVSRSSDSSGLLYRQASDVTDYPGFHSPVDDYLHVLHDSPLYSPTFPQRGTLYHGDSLDYGNHSPLMDSPPWLEHVPPTPAFPVSPPTPYDSRGFLDMHTSVTHTHPHTHPSSAHDNEAGSLSPASHQLIVGSLRSVPAPSPLAYNHSLSPVQGWDETSDRSLFLSPPGTHTHTPTYTPNSPSVPRFPAQSGGRVEPSLLDAVERFGALALGEAPPVLPQKRRGVDGAETGPGSLLNGSSCGSSPELLGNRQDSAKFVQDTTKYWYKPDITREQAIAALKDREPGSFIVRDSHSFRGAYGLAMKVSTPPPSVLQQSRKAGDLSSELVRHFLIECTQKGVRLKGCPNEPYFGSLTALVCQHSITPLALPCKLIIPDSDLLEGLCESLSETATNSAAELLKQGAACNVWFLGSVELESLTGVQGVQKAATVTLALNRPPTSTIVHFKVSAQGITLTDNQRKLFFRRHYPVNTVIFCALDPQERRWTKDGCTDAKIFGFVARKSSMSVENVCHLFAEHDPEQPASAIVNFVSKVMIGSQKSK